MASANQTPRWINNLTQTTAMQQVKDDQRQEVTCLALAIYFEARGEPSRGQQAVGNVVMNRTHSNRYPNTACGVLFQAGQFSFIRGSRPAMPKRDHLWDASIEIAASIIAGETADVSRGALSFCQRHLRRSGYAIGRHIFY